MLAIKNDSIPRGTTALTVCGRAKLPPSPPETTSKAKRGLRCPEDALGGEGGADRAICTCGKEDGSQENGIRKVDISITHLIIAL